MDLWQERLVIYDELVSKCKQFKRKGKTMPYTSANGYMFSVLNKDAQLGIRFSKDVQKKYMSELNTTEFRSYNVVKKGYILMPDEMLNDLDKLSVYLIESYNYIMNLPSK